MDKSHLELARFLANLLDNKFKILGHKFGIDPLLGLLPIGGDALSLFLGLYIVWAGYQAGVPDNKIRRMLANLLVDFLMGAIPVVGDAADFFYKTNEKNMKIIDQHFKGNVEEGEIVG